jgi:hypothetical protein
VSCATVIFSSKPSDQTETKEIMFQMEKNNRGPVERPRKEVRNNGKNNFGNDISLFWDDHRLQRSNSFVEVSQEVVFQGCRRSGLSSTWCYASVKFCKECVSFGQ